jgi:hypothetical protein
MRSPAFWMVAASVALVLVWTAMRTSLPVAPPTED